EKAAPVAGEDAELASERARLVHAERLGSLVGGAESRIYSGETSAVDTLGPALPALREAERLAAGLGAGRARGGQALPEAEGAARRRRGGGARAGRAGAGGARGSGSPAGPVRAVAGARPGEAGDGGAPAGRARAPPEEVRRKRCGSRRAAGSARPRAGAGGRG